MNKRLIIPAGVVSAAALLGGGATAYAATGTSDSAPAVATVAHVTSTAKAKGKHHHRFWLDRALHATWVSAHGKGDKTKFVTHDSIRGSVVRISGTSVTVRAKDGFTQTYRIDSKTKVREAEKGKAVASSASAVKLGLRVLVIGTGKPTNPTANVIRWRIADNAGSASTAS
ncbi:hypothetical protein [Flexivirga caeni]|uniref:DUF5666 domain-containing protein n=1 Tax=Flexivirga caeni TaxID=2294115 RepID=A0A3M9M1T1_9MICO|nr:hypothetical protein [Flexivirga caeni]RNI19531.1 hypothetical protein EFY87_17025 [Flexivirga caeni]